MSKRNALGVGETALALGMGIVGADIVRSGWRSRDPENPGGLLIASYLARKKNRSLMVLTSPHSVCTPELERIHWCDTAAGPAARALAQFFGPQAVYLPATEKRTDYDLNRAEGRVTSYRERVSGYLEQAAWLLDIHSYPDNDRDWGQWEVAIMCPPGSPVGVAERICEDLYPRVGLVWGDEENDICLEASMCGVPSLLIEFNERNLDRIEQMAVEFGEAFVRAMDETL